MDALPALSLFSPLVVAVPSRPRPLLFRCECGSFAGAHFVRFVDKKNTAWYICNMLKKDGSVCVFSDTSTNAHTHAASAHGVDDPCMLWLSTGMGKHRHHRDEEKLEQRRKKLKAGNKKRKQPPQPVPPPSPASTLSGYLSPALTSDSSFPPSPFRYPDSPSAMLGIDYFSLDTQPYTKE